MDFSGILPIMKGKFAPNFSKADELGAVVLF